MSEAVIFLFKTLVDILSVIILLTFLFRFLRVDYYNPIVQGMMRIAEIFTSNLRKIVKPFFGFDFPSLIIVILLQGLAFFLISLSGAIELNYATMVFWSLYSTLLLTLRMMWWSLLIGIIVSWIAPMSTHPAIRVVQQMSDKICGPFRLFLPPMGGLDFSPILAFLLLQFLQIALRNLSFGYGIPISLSIGF